MSTDTRIVLRYTGLMIHVPGIMSLCSLPVCYGWGERYALWPFLATAMASIGLGQLLFRSFRTAEEAQEARLHHGMVVAALGWVVVPVLGSIPFLAVAARLPASGVPPPAVLLFQEPWNALFEAFSGFTGTGLTMAVSPSLLPHCLQWWRSFTEWVGGGGVILLMLSILSHTVSAYHLYYSEGREKKIAPSVISTVRTIWWIYLLLTLLSVLLLRLVGMPWWEALNHGMTGIATGGFSVADSSIGAYGTAVRLTVMVIMILGSVSFAIHYRVLAERHLSALWSNAQHRMLWVLLFLGTVGLGLENAWAGGGVQWIDSAFQWASALGTAGFQTVDLSRWSPTAQLLLSLGMIVGGAAGSTAGGIKQARMAALYQGLRWRFRRIRLRPHQLTHYEFDGETLAEPAATRLVQDAGMLAVLWASFLWAGILVLVHLAPERPLSEVILEVASAQGNVGLSTGITHPGLAWPGKLTLMLSMWIGRLEIIPILILFSSLVGWTAKPFKPASPSA